MDLEWTAEHRAFRDEVRHFFAEEYPQDVLLKMHQGVTLEREDHVRGQEALNGRGWLGVGWPQELGGTGWGEFERYIFESELERVGAPDVIPMSISYIGPIICAFGSEQQKAQWLPAILESRSMWAQGYSEPESGSDLVSLRMTAIRDAEDYIVEGCKIWTSYAQWADWIFCLVRTSRGERKHDGISLLCIAMDSPGVSVHPIFTIDGVHSLNRVEFDNVRVPACNRIGDEGAGWHYANVLLAAERLSLAHVGRKKAALARIRRLAADVPTGGGVSMLDEPAFARRLAALEIDVMVLEISVLRAIMSDITPAAISSLKISCTETAQRIGELWLELGGRSILPAVARDGIGWAECWPESFGWAVPTTAGYLGDRAQTLYGGTTEVQKNIIWKQLDRTLT